MGRYGLTDEELIKIKIKYGVPLTFYESHPLARKPKKTKKGIVFEMSAEDYIRETIVRPTEKQIAKLCRLIEECTPLTVAISPEEEVFDEMLSGSGIFSDSGIQKFSDSGIQKRTLNMFLEALGNPERKWICNIATNPDIRHK